MPKMGRVVALGRNYCFLDTVTYLPAQAHQDSGLLHICDRKGVLLVCLGSRPRGLSFRNLTLRILHCC